MDGFILGVRRFLVKVENEKCEDGVVVAYLHFTLPSRCGWLGCYTVEGW